MDKLATIRKDALEGVEYEVDEELMIKTCHIHGHEYAVITKIN